MKFPKNITFEDIIGIISVIFLISHGWIVTLNEGVMIYGKHGREAYISGYGVLWYIGFTFLTAAIFTMMVSFATFNIKANHSIAISIAVLLHPVVYFLI
ncbi:hypothetical protein [Pseudomonas sp.]|uniref:hypothetical protein n=1 Tax=Pseudomonas sp. TaxID=306 RepID=UPI003C76EEF8